MSSCPVPLLPSPPPSLLTHGSVAAFEPVPDFHAFLEYNLHVNGLAHLVDVRQLIVSAQSGIMLNMTVPSHGIWGTAGISGLNIDTSIKGKADANQFVCLSVHLPQTFIPKETFLVLSVLRSPSSTPTLQIFSISWCIKQNCYPTLGIYCIIRGC